VPARLRRDGQAMARYGLCGRCLLIIPSGPDFSVLLAALADRAVEVDSTSDIGAGVALARAPLDRFDFGVAVVPSSHEGSTVALSAIYVEIGVAAGRGLPLLVVVEPPGAPSPALAGLVTVTTSLDNEEALRLQLGLFLRQVEGGLLAQPNVQPQTAPQHLVPSAYLARLQAVRDSPQLSVGWRSNGVGNTRLPEGLALLPTVLTAECKDWVRPVDSRTVGYFVNILANRGAEAGILIAANGITGDPEELSSAHALSISAVARGIKLLIMTTSEIQGFRCTADLTELLNRRYLRAIMSGGLGIPDPMRHMQSRA